MSLRKRAEPVTLVRSPTLTNGISGVSVKASSPERRSRRGTSGILRGGLPSTARTMAAMCSGVVPQQPPTMLTSPASANSASSRHVIRALVVAAELVGQAGIGIGAHEGVGDAGDLGDVGAHLLGAERAVEPDRDRRGVTHRMPERGRPLTRQKSA